jgi:hypothetical protein
LISSFPTRSILACDVWIWADVINSFARDVFNENQLSDADLRAALLGINIREPAGEQTATQPSA